MARITVEDCLTKENNRFALVQLAAKRTKQILGGSKALVASSNKAVVTSLREIADGRVRFMTPDEAEAARLQQEAEKQAIFDQPTPVPVSPAVAANIHELLGGDDDDDDVDDEIDDEDLDDEDDSDDDSDEKDEEGAEEDKKASNGDESTES